jgi:putative spermidine/putrescine transport system permease protein
MIAPGTHRRRLAWRAKLGPVLLVLPPLAFLFVFFLLPLVRLLALSVEGGTFEFYEKALGDGLYVRVLADTLLIAAYVSVLCFILGYPLAYFLVSAPPFWATLGFILLILPFWTSLLVRTYAWMVLLGRNGIINRLLLETGLIADPLPLLNNMTGVLIGMVHVQLPYMVFPIYSAMKRVDPSLVPAAQGLGAPDWEIFRRVYFPLTLPGVVAGFVLVFIVSVGFFITPALLGGGKVMMIAVLIEKHVREFLNWEFAAALSTVLLAVVLAVYVGLNRLVRRDTA